MNRRELIKGLTAIGALSILPSSILFGQAQDKPLHFIGIGDAGRKVLKHIHQKKIPAKYTCIACSCWHLPWYNSSVLPEDIHVIQLSHIGSSYESEDTSYGQLTFIESYLQTPMKVSTEVTDLFKDDNRYILLAGLGGFTGTFLAEKLTLMLDENKKDFLTICSLPFSFEGKKRSTWANKVRQNLRSIPNVKYFD
ncbi:MAG TPA: hypothetical protein VEV44_17500, partial [Pseudoneobacillus sp.]|nr:hypothetical protein [Pseudoneobacillus sp.]